MAHGTEQGPMGLLDKRTPCEADAGDGDPIRMSTEPAGVVDGTVPDDNTEAESKGQDAAILEDIDIDALLANMDIELPLDEGKVGKVVKGDSVVILEENNVTKATTEGNSDPGDAGMEHTAQDMDDDEYDELFDDDAPDKPPTALHVEPPASQATPPPQMTPSVSTSEFDLSTLDLPTVISNITTLKSAMIDNHLLLSRFLHIQTAYRTLSTTLAKERNLLAHAQAAMARMREEANSISHDSPLLQFQIKQLKDEVLRERAARTQYEATLVQYQENIQAMRTEIEKVRKEKAKLELGVKRAQETLKEGDALRGKVVGLMSENKSLARRMEELEEQEVVRQNRALEEEIGRLREKVVQLEGSNIRLKAGRSILARGEGNTVLDIQPVQTSPTRISAVTATPQAQNTDPIDIADDEVVFVGANNISAPPPPPPPHVSSSQDITSSKTSTTGVPPSAGSSLIMRGPPAPNSPSPPTQV